VAGSGHLPEDNIGKARPDRGAEQQIPELILSILASSSTAEVKHVRLVLITIICCYVLQEGLTPRAKLT
jgi:hypothetical protein